MRNDDETTQLIHCERCDEQEEYIVVMRKQEVIENVDVGFNKKEKYGYIEEYYLCMNCFLRQSYMYTIQEQENFKSEKRVRNSFY